VSGALLAYGHYSHHGGGLGSFLAHAALWHIVGRLLYALPIPVGLVLGVVLALGLVVTRRRRARRYVDA
jgi:hypothetical protein